MLFLAASDDPDSCETDSTSGMVRIVAGGRGGSSAMGDATEMAASGITGNSRPGGIDPLARDGEGGRGGRPTRGDTRFLADSAIPGTFAMGDVGFVAWDDGS